jgi:transcriptional regulator with XRE-family HTH domain
MIDALLPAIMGIMARHKISLRKENTRMRRRLKVTIVTSDFAHQGDVAREAGLSESVLSRIVNGRQLPTAEQAQRIARALEVAADDLFPATR